MTNIPTSSTPRPTFGGEDHELELPKEVLNRESVAARTALFDQFLLKDQKTYYLNTFSRSDKSARQVNTLRAFCSLITGLAAIGTGLIFSITDGNVTTTSSGTVVSVSLLVAVLLVISIIAPALGGAFSTLADLYQWDRLASIYRSALASIEVADSLSPSEKNKTSEYIRRAKIFAKGSLAVMSDETGQWGSLIRTPDQLEAFIKSEAEYASELSEAPNRERPIITDLTERRRPPVPTGSTRPDPTPPANVFAPSGTTSSRQPDQGTGSNLPDSPVISSGTGASTATNSPVLPDLPVNSGSSSQPTTPRPTDDPPLSTPGVG